jgi:hypothetical protein
MKVTMIIMSAFLFSGCVSYEGQSWSATPMTGPKGESVWSIQCHYDPAMCFQVASVYCPDGYQKLEDVAVGHAQGDRRSWSASTGEHHIWMVECNSHYWTTEDDKRVKRLPSSHEPFQRTIPPDL